MATQSVISKPKPKLIKPPKPSPRPQQASLPQTHITLPVTNTSHQCRKMAQLRSVIFVQLPDDPQNITLRRIKHDIQQPISKIFQVLSHLDPKDYLVLRADKMQPVDPNRSLKSYGMGYEEILLLVRHNQQDRQEVQQLARKRHERRVLVQTDDDNNQEFNILGLQTYKDFTEEEIIDEKGVAIIERLGVEQEKKKVVKGGSIFHRKVQIPEEPFSLYYIKSMTPLKYVKQIATQSIDTNTQLLSSLKKQIKLPGANQPTLDHLKQIIEEYIQQQGSRYQILLSEAKIDALAAIPLWTSDAFYRDLNKLLRHKAMLGKYLKYLKYLEEGLKLIPASSVMVYRGMCDYVFPEALRKEGSLMWEHIVFASSGDLAVAKGFTKPGGVLYKVHARRAKLISSLSCYSQEKEYLLAPHTLFKVIKYTENKLQACQVQLQQIPTPRSTNILLWVTDKPSDPEQPSSFDLLSIQLESKHDFSVLRAYSNDQAVDIVMNSSFMVKFMFFNFKVVTTGRQEPMSEQYRKEHKIPAGCVGNPVLELTAFLKARTFAGVVTVFMEDRMEDVAKVDKQLGKYYDGEGRGDREFRPVVTSRMDQILKELVPREKAKKESIKCSQCQLF